MAIKMNTLTSDEIQVSLNKKAKQKALLSQILPYIGFIFLIILFITTTDGKFFDPMNFANLIGQGYTLTIIAVGAVFIFAAGMFDLSIGAVLAVAQLLTAIILRGHYAPVWVAVIVSIATATLCCGTTAVIHLLLRVPIFIVSLCMMSICTGIVTISVEKADVYIPYSELSYFNSTSVMLIVLALVIVAGVLIFKYTRLGRDLKALGGNPTAAVQNGVDRNKSILLAFIMLGICIGIASFISLIRSGSVSGSSGTGIQLNIIVAVVLGGFPLMGGSNAKISSAIIGVLTVTVLSNGLVLMGLDPAWAVLAKGVLFMLIIAITYEKVPSKLIQ